jgi:hypothetical protein
MNRQQLREAKKHLIRENAKQTDVLSDVDRSLWPTVRTMPIRVMRSKKFMVQIFHETAAIRLSVNRTMIDDSGNWLCDITWDELQEIKRQAGYGDAVAVEIFPKDSDIVNVANMRHLWVIPYELDFGWKK